ncbi:MAG: helix-turn-helix domain-containing protein [Planctomycetes bacterium]|nr:helix-turn-helix domain-containing protein [Planctomycetota bacterium]
MDRPRHDHGEGPLRYLLRKRIDAAAELLRFSTLPAQEVARQCGFDNPFYFSRLYRKMRGKPPSAEQKTLKG